MKPFLLKVSIVIGLTTQIMGTAQTLPKDIFSIGVDYRVFDITKVAGQDINLTTGATSGHFHYLSIDNYTARFIPKLRPLFAIDPTLANTQIAKFARRTDTTVRIAYGLSDNTTISLDIPFIEKTIAYNPTYISKLAALGQSTPPNVANGSGIGDATLGLKFKLSSATAIALQYRGGPLAWGKDSTEIEPKRNGFEELYTGFDNDTLTFTGIHDRKFKHFTTHFIGSYVYSTTGTYSFFDLDSAKINPGDLIILQNKYTIKLNSKLSIKPGLIYIYSSTSTIDQNGVNQPMIDSDRSSLYGDLIIHYRPNILVDTFVGYKYPIHSKAANGLYEIPGRLSTPGFFTFGMKLYLSLW